MQKIFPARRRVYLKKHTTQIIALGVMFLVFALPPVIGYARKPPVPAVGEIARRDVIATISFEVLKPDSVWKAESLAVIKSVPVVLKHASAKMPVGEGVKEVPVEDSVFSAFDSVWQAVIAVVDSPKLELRQKVKLVQRILPELTPQQAEQLVLLKGLKDFGRVVRDALRRAYAEGFVSSKLAKEDETVELYSVKTGRRETVYSKSLIANDSTIVLEVEKSFLRRQFVNSPEKVEFAESVMKHFLVPNLVPDWEETERRRKESLSKISRSLASVKEGEKIVSKYQKIDEMTHLKLEWYYKALQKRSLFASFTMKTGAILGSMVLIGVIVIMFAVFMMWKYPEHWEETGFVLVASGSITLVGVLAHILKYFGFSTYAFPILLVPVVIVSLVDDWLAFISAVATILLVSIGFRGNEVFVVSYLISSAVISFRTKNIHFKNLFYRPITYSTLMGLFSVVILSFVFLGVIDFADLVRVGAEFGVSSVVAPFLGLMMLPLAERISGYTTVFTLMDLADMNSILLRKLSVEAPGTFNHSMLVGNAAAAAAEAIGANAILARVGGYYHDIGKLVNPQYFEENQTGINPHQNLSPFESYRIIVAHTTEGVEIGRLHRLPARVLDIIQQHHGTSVVEFFYMKAKEINPTVTRNEFRYPGPKPQFVEAAIVMICDVIEAALRSRRDALPEDLDEIKDFAWKLILDKIEDGQFDEVKISVAEIKRVIETIVPIYKGVYHSRGVHQVAGE